MGAAAEADTAQLCPEAQRPQRIAAKYVCVAGSLVALVLLALALSYPISSILFGGKRLDDVYKNASVDENEIDDTAPHGYRPTRDGFKPVVSETEERPPRPSTPASTTESTTTTTTPSTTTTTQPTTTSTTTTTTPSTTTTTQSTTASTTTMTPETATEQPSTEGSTRRRRRSHRDVPENTTAVSPANGTSRIRPWLNRTRGTATPGYVLYEVSMRKVSIQVVYECLCPRSRRFIVSQLLPVYEMLREYMHLTLLPFGRARVENGSRSSGGDGSNNTAAANNGNGTEGSDGTENATSSISTESPDSTQASTDSANTTDADSRGNSSDHNSTSSPTIRCPRGSRECHANMVQTCVMRHVEETLTAVRIIACMSRHPDPHRVGRRCVEQYGLEWHLVDQCVTAEGKLLMLDMGRKTWLITASVNSTPLVRIEGEMSHVIQIEAQTNLLGLMCERLHNRHEACRGRGNATTTAEDGLVGNDTSTTATPPLNTTLTPSTSC
ncbi:uncharacterized protein [Dermacentor albipictus]|uniref:uncharacterized protein n=1 Tax=Dermacentor albipictus TaxID=60249 RepID=UPI0031FC422C